VRARLATWGIAAIAGGALAVLGAGCGGGGSGSAGGDEKHATGPVAALYVIDHFGGEPGPNGLVPYARAFRRVLGGCRIGPKSLANRVVQLADQASRGSGTSITNLDILEALVRNIGATRVDCANLFVVVEARVEGSSLG
jgi:hypothetical protein